MPFKSKSGGTATESLGKVMSSAQIKAHNALLRSALILEANIKTILLTPGTGHIRESGKDRVGKGSFNTSEIEEEIPFSQRLSAAYPKTRTRTVRKMVRRGRARINIDLSNRASAPGEPPAPDEGTLQRSITHGDVQVAAPSGRGVLGSALTRLSIRVGTNVEYAEPLEFGTTTAGRSRNVVILPRPFMRPAFAASKEQMTATMVTGLKRGAQRGN